MFNNLHIKLNKNLFISLIVILCSIIILIIIYFFYRYKQKQTKEIILEKENSNCPKLIDQLMRKSLELAKTAEQVADQHEKKFILKDNIQLHL